MTAMTATKTRDAGTSIPGGLGIPLPPNAGPWGERSRQRAQEPEQFTLVEALVIAISTPNFWLWVENFPRNMDIEGMRGRKPSTPDYVKAAYMMAAFRARSMRMMVRLLSKPENVFMIHTALKMHKPPEYNEVPENPPSLSQMKSFVVHFKHLEDEMIRLMADEQTVGWTRVAQDWGLLNPDAERSLTHPDLDQTITMDGTIMLPAFGRGEDDSVGPQIKYNDENAVNKEIGSKVITTMTRVQDKPGSRLLLRLDMVPPGANGGPGGEAPIAERAAMAINDMTGGAVQSLIIDSVIRGSANCRLAHAGIALVSYPHAKSNKNRSKQGRFADDRQEKALEVAQLTSIKDRKTGKPTCSCSAPLLLVGSVPMTRGRDETGTEALTPLKVISTEQRKDSNGYRWYAKYWVWCKHGGFKARYRLFPEKQGIDASIGEVTRVFPVGSEQFKTLYGRRNDTESWHNQLKRNRDRMPVRGMKAQSVFLIGLQILENAEAVERMRNKSGPPSTLEIIRQMLKERLAA